MEFTVKKSWDTNFPVFTQPEIVGHFSVDNNRKIEQDLSQLKYLYYEVRDGKVRLDLDALYNQFVKKNEVDEKIDHILKWILENSQFLRNHSDTSKWLAPDFISFRGLLTKIATTPYDNREGWIICASKFRGNIYLCAFESEEEKKRKETVPSRVERICCWGHIFETYVLSNQPNQKPNFKNKIYAAEEFCCLFKSKLGHHSLFYGAEMDGIRSRSVVHGNTNLNKLEFVEVKTSRFVETFNQKRNFAKKILKWWIQSFLVGIEEIICGFRDDRGVVGEIRTYPLRELCDKGKHQWLPGPVMNFGIAFFDFVKRVVREDYDKKLYKFTYTPGENIRVEVLTPNCEFAFLPEWYTSK